MYIYLYILENDPILRPYFRLSVIITLDLKENRFITFFFFACLNFPRKNNHVSILRYFAAVKDEKAA